VEACAARAEARVRLGSTASTPALGSRSLWHQHSLKESARAEGHKKRRSTRGHKRRSTRAAESNAQGNLHQPAESAVQGGALGTRDDAVIFSGVIGPPTMSSSHVSAPVTVPWERAEPHAVVRRVKLELPGSWKNSMWTTSPPACVELVQLCVPSPSAVPQCPVVLW
jgi:hypothetical protein